MSEFNDRIAQLVWAARQDCLSRLVGDAVTDDTAALQHYVDSGFSLSELPPGKYRFTGGLL